MKSAMLLNLVALSAIGSVTAESNFDPVVDLGYASFQGITNDTVNTNTFYGLRYAQPPVGELRFRAPQPIERSTYYNTSAVVDATTVGPMCIQGYPGFLINDTAQPLEPGSEDCLLLNVLVPTQPKASSLPVMVQIHGGGYAIGDAESYPGFALVNQSQGGIIYVSIQYRLNAFGWLGSAAVRENGDANAGLLDQRLALDWVQRNIRPFGGDPSKVTIIGGSAGGGSVMNQMILYGGEANPPFRAVIAEYPWWQPYHNNTILDAQYNEVLNAADCTDLTCLRSVSSDVLNNASQAAQVVGFYDNPDYYGYGDFYYGPSVDGYVVRDLPSNEFKKGHFSKVPLLVDHDGYEGVIFSNISETTMTEETMDLQVVFPYAMSSFFTRLYQLYPASNFNSTFFQRQQIFGDFIIDCPTYYMATATSSYSLPTWKLVFDAGTELHGATVPFLFSVAPPNNVTLGYIMKDWFLSFAINLDPNVESFTGVEKPYWPMYASDGGFEIMDVNYTMMGVEPDYDVSPQCDFFHGQSYAVRN